ncbi:MAG: 16S rRNA (cytosine(967)-C(5))-methyltransferase RsmB [Gammaproteobacteria bacterium]
MNKPSSKLYRGRWAPGAETLASAARAMARISFDGRSADDALSPFDTATDRSAIRAITLGTTRWYLRLTAVLDILLEHPERLSPEIRALLATALHQIEYSRNPLHATVDAAVDAARVLRQERAAGLVNGVLRRFVREKAVLLEKVDASIAVRTAHPQWLVDAIQAAWPEHAESVLNANNGHPPMVIRVDTSRVSIEDYIAELAAVGIIGKPIVWAASAIELVQPVSVTALPGFSEGRVSVQDSGAQLAAPLLDAKPGMRVLDACCAPGGKTGHLLEHTPGLAEVVAVDIEERRFPRVRENLERLRRSATLIAADVRKPDGWWDRRRFDRILVDAPCSSTGVIRRHPDIKLLRRATDIETLAATQLSILEACFRMLAPGGRLVYATCSVLPAENQDVLAEFLKKQRRARIVPATLAAQVPGAQATGSGVNATGTGVQLLPGSEAGTDGFHYACVEKTTDGT